MKNVQGTTGFLKNPSGVAGSAGTMLSGKSSFAGMNGQSAGKGESKAKDKTTDEKKDTAKDKTKSSEKETDTVKETKSSFSEDTGDKSQAPDTADLKKNSSSGKRNIFAAFTGLRLSTKLMLAGAVAGLAYILLFAAAKRYYKRMNKGTGKRIRI